MFRKALAFIMFFFVFDEGRASHTENTETSEIAPFNLEKLDPKALKRSPKYRDLKNPNSWGALPPRKGSTNSISFEGDESGGHSSRKCSTNSLFSGGEESGGYSSRKCSADMFFSEKEESQEFSLSESFSKTTPISSQRVEKPGIAKSLLRPYEGRNIIVFLMNSSGGRAYKTSFTYGEPKKEKKKKRTWESFYLHQEMEAYLKVNGVSKPLAIPTDKECQKLAAQGLCEPSAFKDYLLRENQRIIKERNYSAKVVFINSTNTVKLILYGGRAKKVPSWDFTPANLGRVFDSKDSVQSTDFFKQEAEKMEKKYGSLHEDVKVFSERLTELSKKEKKEWGLSEPETLKCLEIIIKIHGLPRSFKEFKIQFKKSDFVFKKSW